MHKGTVKFFNTAEAWGYLKTRDHGAVYVMSKTIDRRDPARVRCPYCKQRIVFAAPGTPVEYELDPQLTTGGRLQAKTWRTTPIKISD